MSDWEPAFLPGDEVVIELPMDTEEGFIRRVQSKHARTYRVAVWRIDKKTGRKYTVDHVYPEGELAMDAP